MQLNAKPVRLLMHEMTENMKLQLGQTFTKNQAREWFKQNYPNVKEGTVAAHLIRMSTNVATRLHYNPKIGGADDLLFKIDSNHFRLYNPATDPSPITAQSTSPEADPEPVDEGSAGGGSEFAYEHDLRDYLAKNLYHIETGLKLYQEDEITGIEFPAGGRFIDILAVDTHGNYVVIELKVSKGYDRVVGQLLRYVAWIEKHHAEAGQTVRGVIVAKEISEDLKLACSKLPDVRLYEYSLSVSLDEITVK